MAGMKWSDKCILELTHHNLFEDDAHRSRFRDLLDCYFDAPFFTKGLCKCMYLSAWDNAHFAQMLDVLNELTIEHAGSLSLMVDNGTALIRQAQDDNNRTDVLVIGLSASFLTDTPIDLSPLRELEISDPDTAYIVKRALQAASCIDELPAIKR